MTAKEQDPDLVGLFVKLFLQLVAKPLSPSVLKKHENYVHHINELRENLSKLEHSEGHQSLELNDQKIHLCSAIMDTQADIFRLIHENTPAAMGSRKCLMFDRKAFEQLKVHIAQHTGKFSSVNPAWNNLDKFLILLEDKYKLIAKDDEEFWYRSLLEYVADQFESTELLFKRVYEQLTLLYKRLRKVLEIRTVGLATMQELDFNNMVSNINKELESTYKQDVDAFKELCGLIDNKENRAYSLLESLHTDTRYS